MDFICKKCGKGFSVVRRSKKYLSKRKFCSLKCYHKSPEKKATLFKKNHEPLLNQWGEKNNQWKGEKAGYGPLHRWLRVKYGKPNKCESENCKKISIRFSYALIKGREYSRNREDYKMLCQSCHSKYDYKGNLQNIR